MFLSTRIMHVLFLYIIFEYVFHITITITYYTYVHYVLTFPEIKYRDMD